MTYLMLIILLAAGFAAWYGVDMWREYMTRKELERDIAEFQKETND